MRINHNIQALNAYRNLYQNQSATAKNLEKLSSGLRVNRAADDAAGLAISEKMRSQIRGLNQAETNSLDGVSLMQVAEGAMTEVHSMLQRMRELTVQAANDTNTLSDREAIQLEIDELLKEIDSIADKTEFNTRRLLDGSSAADAQYIVGENTNTNIVNVPVIKNAEMESGTYAISVNSEPKIINSLNQPGAGISQANVLNYIESKVIDGTAAELGTYSISGITKTAPNVNFNTTVTPGMYDLAIDSSDAANQKVYLNGELGVLSGSKYTFTNGATINKADIVGIGNVNFKLDVNAVPSSVSASNNNLPTPIINLELGTSPLPTGSHELVIEKVDADNIKVTMTIGNGTPISNVIAGPDYTSTILTTGIIVNASGIVDDIPVGSQKVYSFANGQTANSVEVNAATSPAAVLVNAADPADNTDAGNYRLTVINNGTAVSYTLENKDTNVVYNLNPNQNLNQKILFENNLAFNLNGMTIPVGNTVYDFKVDPALSSSVIDSNQIKPNVTLGNQNYIAGNYVLEVSSNATALTSAKLGDEVVTITNNKAAFSNGMIFDLSSTPATNSTAKFDYSLTTITPPKAATTDTIKPGSQLPLGEYTITVSGFNQGNPANATIEIFGPDGFSIGSLATEVGAGVSPAKQTIGTLPAALEIDVTQITQAGTAKVQLEAEMQVEVSKIGKDSDNEIRDAVTGEFLEKTPITFNKTITTRNGKVTHGGLEMNFDSTVKQGESAFDLTNKSLTFQIGANTNQSLNIDVPQLSTVKLGINGLQILSHDEANRSLHKIDQAITAISATRAKLGATQNRLEHTISNLQVTAENLTSAESRIRDADMAKEMTDFTKNNILNQSAQAMLAQANQLPQGVLQLLQG